MYVRSTRARGAVAHLQSRAQRDTIARLNFFHSELYTIQIRKENISSLKKKYKENIKKVLTQY